MTPLKHSTNFAARMGRWSANHWKTAVFGWLAFVVASVFIGGAVGTKYLEPSDLAVGEARTADQDHRGRLPRQKADEQGEFVLDPVEDADRRRSRLPGGDRGRRRRPCDTFPQVTEAPLAARCRSRRPDLADRHSAMVQFSPKGTYEEAIALHRDDRGRGRQGCSPASGLRDRRARQRQHRQGARRGLRGPCSPRRE